MENLEILDELKKNENSCQEKPISVKEVAEHHQKIMKQLEEMGFVPNPVQRITVEDTIPMYPRFSERVDKDKYI